ncbi:MT-A70 family [Sarocladium strictum]
MRGGGLNPGTALASSCLFRSPDTTVLLLDIPRSIEEAQVPHGLSPTRRLVSAPAATEPFTVPEPKYGDGGTRSQAAQIADLMTEGAVEHGLDVITEQHDGLWCLPRVTNPSGLTSPIPEPHIPDGARYVQGALKDTHKELAGEAPIFDLIIMDPPWPNRSARRRSNKYDMVRDLAEMQDLLSYVPVRTHLAPNGVVAVWVTNKESVLDCVLSPSGLFSSWGLRLVSEWTWVKVTSHGEPITPLDSAWRKPWEKLLIAQRVEARPIPALSQNRLLFAVPDVHSRKPSLRGVFHDAFGQDFTALEVFARNLTAGWWSWGNEVLQFQGREHWLIDEKAP